MDSANQRVMVVNPRPLSTMRTPSLQGFPHRPGVLPCDDAFNFVQSSVEEEESMKMKVGLMAGLLAMGAVAAQAAGVNTKNCELAPTGKGYGVCQTPKGQQGNP